MVTIKNSEVFFKDPTTYTIPNDGVAKVAPLSKSDKNDWIVARYELENFVCKGSYHEGLRRILQSYLDHLDKASQPAVWVSGFFGCGKSHLVRILDFLWRNIEFSDGTKGRDLCNLPDDVKVLLKELSTETKRSGGIWSAAGTMSAGGGDGPRTDLLQLVLRSAGLPENIEVARVHLWLEECGILDDVREYLISIDKEKDLLHPFVSPKFIEAVIKFHPDYSGDEDPKDVKNDLRREFRTSSGISNTEMVSMLNQIFLMQSENKDKLPLVLIILDEVQQYLTIGDGSDKLLDFQEAVEECCRRFSGKVLFIATGQEALQANTQLQRLQGRFSEKVILESKDVDTVLRETVLLKKESMKPELRSVLDRVNGEISRHISNSKLAHRQEDDRFILSDYPLLPTRKRFWERVLASVDPDGMGNQLRNQLRLVFDGLKDYAGCDIGHFIPADYIYTQNKRYLRQNYILTQNVDDLISRENDGTEKGELRSRICATIFLIQHIDPSYGIKAEPETICDLMVSDLVSGSESLRQSVPLLLEDMHTRGVLAHIDTEYRIQTEEGGVWEGDYQKRRAKFKGDDTRIIDERVKFIKNRMSGILGSVNLIQGESRTPRNVSVTYFGDERPRTGKEIPVWVRNGWDIPEKDVINECAAEGNESSIVTVFIPLEFNDELKNEIAGYLAADRVIDRKGTPNTQDGIQAKQNIETKRERHKARAERIVDDILRDAKVILGGGTVVPGDSVSECIKDASNRAMVRMYPKFDDGDAAGWDKVIRAVAKGEQSPLSKIGFSRDPKEHPVCREILKRLNSEKKGSELLKALGEPPFGWPKDAINAGLIVLVASEYVNVKLNNRPAGAVDLNARNIGNASFEVEDVVLSTNEKFGARKMYAELGLSGKSGKETEEAGLFLEKLNALAKSTGGDAPLPYAAEPPYLSELAGYSGNSLVKELNERREIILSDIKLWKATAELIDSRSKEWATFSRLLDHSEGLPDYDLFDGEAKSVIAGRSLLSDPDPVEPLLSDLRNSIRDYYTAGAGSVNKARKEVTDSLESDSYCRELADDKRESLLKEYGLDDEFTVTVGSDEEIFTQLRKIPVNSLKSRAELTRSYLPKIKERIARMLEPETVVISLKSPVTIKSSEELEDYLLSVKEEAEKALNDGNPVMLR
ncbi:BREX system P-loop protein BrxC [Methanoplanus limicola]|uniref:BREX system P-loop protein BrxC n=1 Tax=Methanoplanus limicola DSM 2279 TaxID=937775 RepID=H1Z0U2_9EURY|nr:BREX system P-loop protein BrxC [Methanoplanus limicola]EHQ36235.1 hypothetical protein Metlim_2162 [Methanoplanus limicola DSM 2279]